MIEMHNYLKGELRNFKRPNLEGRIRNVPMTETPNYLKAESEMAELLK